MDNNYQLSFSLLKEKQVIQHIDFYNLVHKAKTSNTNRGSFIKNIEHLYLKTAVYLFGIEFHDETSNDNPLGKEPIFTKDDNDIIAKYYTSKFSCLSLYTDLVLITTVLTLLSNYNCIKEEIDIAESEVMGELKDINGNVQFKRSCVYEIKYNENNEYIKRYSIFNKFNIDPYRINILDLRQLMYRLYTVWVKSILKHDDMNGV